MHMRTSAGAKALDRTRARNCFLINQFATPGLGSLMAGRPVAGIGQLLVAVAGFVLVMIWFALRMSQLYNEVVNDAQPQSAAWAGEFGAALFAAAWLWSLFTSLGVLREASAAEPAPPPKLEA
jgi:hypothetical protein